MTTPPRSRTLPSGRARSAGFSMIEVLIALVVLALGLLGFALLQTMNLRYTQSANYRTQATNLAYDLLDQMRGNRLTAAEYADATFTAGSVTVPATGCDRPLGVEVAITSNVARWQCQVVEALGAEASADVAYAAGVATVTITWGERLTGADANTQFIVSTQL